MLNSLFKPNPKTISRENTNSALRVCNTELRVTSFILVLYILLCRWGLGRAWHCSSESTYATSAHVAKWSTTDRQTNTHRTTNSSLTRPSCRYRVGFVACCLRLTTASSTWTWLNCQHIIIGRRLEGGWNVRKRFEFINFLCNMTLSFYSKYIKKAFRIWI